MMMAKVNVRPAHYTDFDAISEMMKGFVTLHHRWQPEVFRTTMLGFTAAIFQGWLERKNERHLAAEVEGIVSGYACAARSDGWSNDLVWQRRNVYVPFVVVAPGKRRNGIGRALFAAIEVWAAEFEAEYIGLNVSPLNETARAFYAALGYEASNEYRAKTLRKIARIASPPGPE